MSNRIARLFNAHGPDRVAIVSVEPSHGSEDRFLIRLARGQKSGQLSTGTTFGPFSSDEVDQRFDQLLGQLHGEGFIESGKHDLLEKLSDSDPSLRARAALKLGWLKQTDAVLPLMGLLDSAVDDLCSIIDALGAIGDQRAVQAVRAQATKKLLSRRRSAVEALRNMGDQQGLEITQQRAADRLPDNIATIILQDDLDVSAVVELIEASDPQRIGLYLDTIYEIGKPGCVEVAQVFLHEISYPTPYVWRYVKSILKRSMLRGDHTTFGLLAHRIEHQSRTLKPVFADVKSGYDGVVRNTPIFGRKTQKYVRRSTWRHLRQLAKYRPEHYTRAAAEVLIHYTAADVREPKGRLGQFADCFLLSKSLYGASNRFTYDDRRLRHAFKDSSSVKAPEQVREESFPDLWDQFPKPLLRLLANATLPEIQQFALSSIQSRHPGLIRQASIEQLVLMLGFPLKAGVELAIDEIDRRFDFGEPNWSLLDRLIDDEREFVVQRVHRWLRETAALWAAELDRVCDYLQSANPTTQMLVAELVPQYIRNEDKSDLAQRFLDLLRDVSQSRLDMVALVSRTLLVNEINDLLSTNELLQLIDSPSVPVQSVAAEVLAIRPHLAKEIGIAGLCELADHQVVFVRRASQKLFQSIEFDWQADPSVLFALVESRWPDVRQFAMQMLDEHIDWSSVSTDALYGIVDSNLVDVQDFGIKQIRARFDSLDLSELTFRLAEHPHVHLRQFAVEMCTQHLADGIDSLRRFEPFFRSCLFDTWPQRSAKHQIIEFLGRRGNADLAQANFAASILNDFVRTRGQNDFERAIQTLSRIRLAYPEANACIETEVVSG